MPRVSIRKLFVSVLAVASLILLAINVHQSLVAQAGGKYAGWYMQLQGGLSGPSGSGSGSVSGSGSAGRAHVGLKENLRRIAGEDDDEETENPSRALERGESVVIRANEEEEGEDGKKKGKEDYNIEVLLSSDAPPLPPRKYDLSPLDPSDKDLPPPDKRPWYMGKEGSVTPQNCPLDPDTGRRKAILLPEEAPDSDRVVDQLMYFPPKGQIADNLESSDIPLKKILLWNGVNSWGNMRPGRGVFLKENCPVNSCAITSSRGEAQQADLVIFKDHFTRPTYQRPKNQLWMIYMLECPLHTQMFKIKDAFNWTATYRSDSTIVAPYERWQYYNDNVRQLEQNRNYAANKTKAVAWFVSNCGARNGRLQYAKELQKYIQVDIYGACGTKKCPRSKSKDCFDMLDKDYKFYLAFENSNCKDYITEKFYVNGLGHDVLPIAMGARPEDYARSAPEHSFIHVDDFAGPKELADYLHKLDQDDELYNQYFKWKGTGQFLNTKFMCRVCAMLHDEVATTSSLRMRQPETGDGDMQDFSYYKDINSWWRSPGTCINGSWRKFRKALQKEKAKKEATNKP